MKKNISWAIRTRDITMEKEGGDTKKRRAKMKKEEGKEKKIKPSRCWLESGRAVSASGTCCHSEGWGVKLVSAEALRGVRWLRARRQKNLDGETQRERQTWAESECGNKAGCRNNGRVGRNNRLRWIKCEHVWQKPASRVIVWCVCVCISLPFYIAATPTLVSH